MSVTHADEDSMRMRCAVDVAHWRAAQKVREYIRLALGREITTADAKDISQIAVLEYLDVLSDETRGLR